MLVESLKGSESDANTELTIEERFQELLRSATTTSRRPRQVPNLHDLWNGIQQIVEPQSKKAHSS